jgi:hypothetical protein
MTVKNRMPAGSGHAAEEGDNQLRDPLDPDQAAADLLIEEEIFPTCA